MKNEFASDFIKSYVDKAVAVSQGTFSGYTEVTNGHQHEFLLVYDELSQKFVGRTISTSSGPDHCHYIIETFPVLPVGEKKTLEMLIQAYNQQSAKLETHASHMYKDTHTHNVEVYFSNIAKVEKWNSTPEPVPPAVASDTELKFWIDEVDKFIEEKKVQGAVWDTAFINRLPDAAFAVIAPGGKKDSEGKTVPRTLRKLPHHGMNVKKSTENSSVDVLHLRNALARMNQVQPANLQNKAKSHLLTHAKELLPSSQFISKKGE